MPAPFDNVDLMIKQLTTENNNLRVENTKWVSRFTQLEVWLVEQTNSMCEKKRFDAFGEILTKIRQLTGE